MKSPTSPHGRLTASPRLICTGLVAAFALAACGGGGGNPGSVRAPQTGTTGPNTGADPDLATLGNAFDTYWNRCAKPRTGTDPYTGKPYPDKQGTLRDELTFLRAWTHQNYLWYDKIPTDFRMADFNDPVSYFDKLMAPNDKRMYHFTYPTAEWDKLSNSGIELGYGITWSSNGATAPRTWYIAIVEPGSPAAAAGLRRGDQLTVIDGVDFVNSSGAEAVDKINAGLFPDQAGTVHTLGFKRGTTDITASMQAKDVAAESVKYTRVINTATGPVGYLSFENHNAVAERQLIDSITTLRNAGVTDLVLDLRYNGGGLLAVAGELAYMIAGPSTKDKVFSQLKYNNKIEASQTPEIIRFQPTAYGFAAGATTVPKGTPLPYLGLNRVTILTTSGTCSASESIINGLRGVDIEVNVIGDTTCGKPYGFTPVPNCGTTYFSVEFQGVNAKGFGDYANGLAPTCQVSDDLAHDLGDANEALLSTALSYRVNGFCPGRTSAQAMARATSTQVRPLVSQIAIYNKAR